MNIPINSYYILKYNYNFITVDLPHVKSFWIEDY